MFVVWDLLMKSDLCETVVWYFNIFLKEIVTHCANANPVYVDFDGHLTLDHRATYVVYVAVYVLSMSHLRRCSLGVWKRHICLPRYLLFDYYCIIWLEKTSPAEGSPACLSWLCLLCSSSSLFKPLFLTLFFKSAPQPPYFATSAFHENIQHGGNTRKSSFTIFTFFLVSRLKWLPKIEEIHTFQACICDDFILDAVNTCLVIFTVHAKCTATALHLFKGVPW